LGAEGTNRSVEEARGVNEENAAEKCSVSPSGTLAGGKNLVRGAKGPEAGDKGGVKGGARPPFLREIGGTRVQGNLEGPRPGSSLVKESF